MNNMVQSIIQHLKNNCVALGLASADDVREIQRSRKPFLPGSKLLIVTPLRTSGDRARATPFGNLLRTGVKGEHFMTQVEVECFTRAGHPDADYPWYTARGQRDLLYDLLAGANRGGLSIPRNDYSVAPAAMAGEIWFEVDGHSSPMEDEVEDPNDQANKSVFLTYNVHWWRPI